MKKTIGALIAGIASGMILVSLIPIASSAASFFFVDTAGNVGIGNSTPAATLDVSGSIYSRLVTATSSTINWNLGNVQALTLTSSPTLTFSSGQSGGEYKLILHQDGTGGRTVTWPSSVLWAGGIKPSLTSSANATDTISFVYDGSNYLGTYNLNYLKTTLTNNIVHYWKLDGNSNDAVGSDNGTDTTITYSNANGIINNGAGGMSGSSHIDIGSATVGIANAWTINFWVKPTFNTSDDRPLQISSVAANLIRLAYDTTGKVTAEVVDSGGSNEKSYTTSSSALTASTYQMVTWTWDGTNLYCYVNGSSQTLTKTTDQSVTQTDTSRTVTFGNAPTHDHGITGAMDEIGVWSRALSGSEITTLYNSDSGDQYPF